MPNRARTIEGMPAIASIVDSVTRASAVGPAVLDQPDRDRDADRQRDRDPHRGDDQGAEEGVGEAAAFRLWLKPAGGRRDQHRGLQVLDPLDEAGRRRSRPRSRRRAGRAPSRSPGRCGRAGARWRCPRPRPWGASARRRRGRRLRRRRRRRGDRGLHQAAPRICASSAARPSRSSEKNAAEKSSTAAIAKRVALAGGELELVDVLDDRRRQRPRGLVDEDQAVGRVGGEARPSRRPSPASPPRRSPGRPRARCRRRSPGGRCARRSSRSCASG